MEEEKNKFFKTYSQSTKQSILDEILKGQLNSYIKSNESLDRFSNWCLAISGTMIPLILLNIQKLEKFYDEINLNFLINVLLISCFFGLFSKYYAFKIGNIQPFIEYENDIKNIYSTFDEEIEIVQKSGNQIEIDDKDITNIVARFYKYLNIPAKTYFQVKLFLNPKFILINKNEILTSHKKAAKLTSNRHVVFIIQLITLIVSFIYLVFKLKHLSSF